MFYSVFGNSQFTAGQTSIVLNFSSNAMTNFSSDLAKGKYIQKPDLSTLVSIRGSSDTIQMSAFLDGRFS